MINDDQLKQMADIYEEYNLCEDEPDSVDTFDTVNYLLDLLGMDEAMYKVVKGIE